MKAQLEDFLAVILLLTSIPGVDKLTAEDIVAEIETDMNQLPNENCVS